MAVKFLYYFIFAFVGIMVFLLYQKPYDVVKSKNSKNSPNIEMINMVNYSITEDGVSHIVRASKVLRFVNHDEFYNVEATRKSKKTLLENLKADSGVLVKDDLKLEGNVRYRNSDSVKFKSQKADYNLKTRVFKTDVDFTLEDNRSITYGTSMVYKTIEGKIYANNIKSIIEEEKK
ncbi:MAG TPA: LPS export ABC transporter periplasmic protein LptC [Sulfurospirillum arcachonense]|nr:LPS export ABC transporter periplasmic protein LptC [Sulfurospirillum arcachonense]